MPLTLEQANDRPTPLAALLGVRFTAVEADRVVAELEVRPEHCTLPAGVHGGVLMAFADNVGAIATVANLPEGAGTTTLESKTNFLAGAPAGSLLTAVCTPVHRGRRTQVWQTRVESGGKLLSLTTQTQMVL